MDLLIRNFKPNVSEQTIKTYCHSINSVMNMLDVSDNKILYNSDLIIKKIHDTNLNSQKIKINSIMILINCMRTKTNLKKTEKSLKLYYDRIEEINSELNSELDKNKKNDKMKDKWLSEDDIKKVNETLLNNIPAKINTINDLNDFRDYIIWMIHLSIPTRNDLIYSKIMMKPKNMSVCDVSDENFILLDKSKKEVLYVRNVSKTSKTSSEKIFKLNPELYDFLLVYRKEVYKFNKNRLLILGDRGEKISANRFGVIFSNICKRILGRSVGTTMIRHIKASEGLDIEKIKEDAKRQGHSVNMHLQYIKND